MQEFNYKNCEVTVRPTINPETRKWYAEYRITQYYPEGTRFRGFAGKKEFSNQKDCFEYYKKLAKIDIDHD